MYAIRSYYVKPVSWNETLRDAQKMPRYGANLWHSDVTWRETPSLGSVLRGRIIPEVGGDTLWSDQVAAYEGLSPAMKECVITSYSIHYTKLYEIKRIRRLT